MRITKALADGTRLRMLMALRGRELCVCQLTELFHIAPSTASRHLSILAAAGLVVARRDGRWTHYRVPPADAPGAAALMADWMSIHLGQDVVVRDDVRRLGVILRQDPSELCRRQTTK